MPIFLENPSDLPFDLFVLTSETQAKILNN